MDGPHLKIKFDKNIEKVPILSDLHVYKWGPLIALGERAEEDPV